LKDIIVGIDPGSRITGYGVIGLEGKQTHYIASGCIKITQTDVAQKLLQIQSSLKELLEEYRPSMAAIEDVFVHQNPRGALKLGQARGVAIATVAHYGLSVHEYSPRLIKQAVVGSGSADKTQVQFMVRHLLKLSSSLQTDAADALAVALTHACLHDSPLLA
jgi:crossover junction endodeoxyribonuclease RuvC